MSQIATAASVALALAACAGAGEMGGGEAPDAYVERLGNDTTALEIVHRSPNAVTGTVVARVPVTRVIDYSATLDDEGRVSEFHLDLSTPEENPEGPTDQSFTAMFEGDSATVIRSTADGADTSRVAAEGLTIPRVGRVPDPVGLVELALAPAVTGNMDTLAFEQLNLGRGNLSANRVAQEQGDTVSLDFFGMKYLVRVDDEGHVLGATGRETTVKVSVEPDTALTDTRLSELAADFAARDARGEGIGMASPAATVDETVGGAHLTVDYSRPAKRGREIFGGLVPYNEVWRTGANAATVFTTDRDLMMAGQQIPAGSYTLWSTYTPEGGTLIVNSQTGQWGTQYDEGQDFVRLPMKAASVADPVERFTIAVVPSGGGGELSLTWDTTRYSVPFTVR